MVVLWYELYEVFMEGEVLLVGVDELEGGLFKTMVFCFITIFL